uniref:C-type lectin domain-containing protein n=1 Tax=Pundamilia nyererei TaxID=303518 RepID=A0A3B4FY32_9CICH
MKISCASQPCLALSREPTSPPSLQDSLKPHPPTTRHYFIPRPLFCERQIRFVNLKLKLSVDPNESVTALTYSCPLSGYVMVCHFQSDQLVRQLHLVDLQKSWNDAQKYCRDEYIDLAIVNSSALIQEAQKWAGSTEVWIGLSKSDWKWSRLGPVQSPWFHSWSPGQPGTGECVTISSDGSCYIKKANLQVLKNRNKEYIKISIQIFRNNNIKSILI